MKTVGETLVDLLAAYGVDTVFGIPGVHTIELYRGLAASPIRHVTPRHEQGAGFMADGYARMTGRPGVAFVITGPGLTNIATAMAQARGDSIPMLVISGVAARADLGRRIGGLHELPDQQGLASRIAVFSHTLLDPADLPVVLAQAFALFASGRPGPVHIEIPIDVMAERIATPAAPPPPPDPSVPDADAIKAAASRLRRARSPVILAGGGARRAAVPLRALAKTLDAPVVTTVNGRGLMAGHPLSVPASPSLAAIRALIEDADCVLALGTELGMTDFDMNSDGGFPALPGLVRVDIDPGQIARGPEPKVGMTGDAARTAAALARRLSARPLQGDGAARAAAARDAALAELAPDMRAQLGLLAAIRTALPGCVIVGDSTQPIYAGNLAFEPDGPGLWFNSATGFGTLGYAAPAAIGAKLAAPDRPVVALTGDGGLQFTLAELGVARDTGVAVIFLVWNNRGYGEIERAMRAAGIAPEGVTPSPPDFVAVARAYGIEAIRLTDLAGLPEALRRAAATARPALVEITA